MNDWETEKFSPKKVTFPPKFFLLKGKYENKKDYVSHKS